MGQDKLNISAITPESAAKIFSAVYSRKITPQQVLELAKAGGLIRENGTFSMIEYIAYLAKEMGNG